ncbi:MAG: TVP38/TMEM64 family protein [Thermodesulfobacteriota bacterium]
MNKQSLKRIIILLSLLGGTAVIGGSVYLIHYWPANWTFPYGVIVHGNIERLKSFIVSYGYWAPLISALLMICQSIILFLPAFPIFIVNAIAFGLIWGTLLSWGSAVSGSLICFTIAKTFGRPVVQRLVNKVHLQTADVALKKYEKYVILFFGFIPIISYDVVSYAAGLTILSFWEFFPLVCLAQIPSSLFYSLLVHKIDQGTLDIYWIIAAVLFFLIGISSLVLRTFFSRRRREELPHTIY